LFSLFALVLVAVQQELEQLLRNPVACVCWRHRCWIETVRILVKSLKPAWLPHRGV